MKKLTLILYMKSLKNMANFSSKSRIHELLKVIKCRNTGKNSVCWDLTHAWAKPISLKFIRNQEPKSVIHPLPMKMTKKLSNGLSFLISRKSFVNPTVNVQIKS